MNEKLENELYQIDPVFFEHAINCKDGKENEMTTCMYFGCECGDGWFEPLKKFIKTVAFVNSIAKDHNIKYVCDQLKEKFGGLRVYYSCLLIDEAKESDNQELVDILNSIVDEAYKKCEDDCWNVCEWCGTDGGCNGKNLVTTSGWISRICKKCAKAKAEKETQHYDEIHNEKYVPRITWFHDGYEFLNLYDINSFKYQEKYYYSIIEAFYSTKDQKHAKEFYNVIGSNYENKNTPYFIEKLANEFGFKYEDNETDYNLLKDIVRAKFSYEYNKDIREELIETNGKDLFNMGRHHNNILGYCICKDCENLDHKDLYSKILMEIRKEFVDGSKSCKQQ